MYYLDKILVLFIYAVIGLVFLDIVYCHIKELEWKVWDIDPRFIPKLWMIVLTLMKNCWNLAYVKNRHVGFCRKT